MRTLFSQFGHDIGVEQIHRQLREGTRGTAALFAALRDLQVKPQFTGDLPTGVRIERVEVTPEIVSLKGPKTLLDSMKTVPTLPIDLTGRRTSFRESVELTPLQYPYGSAQRHWVELDVRIGVTPSVDSNFGHGVEQGP